ncbi:protein translocase subunit SecF [Streptomyces sp. N2-109]|uniref:Protein-export membrane protein SecF n=1 Tax=Streptomyces gossypii TaxID=2883101 RepID=A0ABT2JL20_9ACTN|nr:protein translocase subunit SecF [Streptomyces gossypii]MCT2588576.1 protein translocase subunit SecF [Streptomyces gossypii]
MSRLGTLGGKLYRGETSYDFVGHRKLWYGITLCIVVVSMLGLGFRGLNMGIEFQGGAVFTTPPTKISVEDARQTAEEATGRDARVQKLGSDALRIQVTGLDTQESAKPRAALAEELGVATQKVNAELVGASWGDQMTDKAIQGLIVFLILVSVYLAFAFEWRMAVAALVALLHDLAVTVGIYALVGFEVTPGTVVGMLTILGYSLYDTVVVFDKVKEKTKDVTKQFRYTYGELSNLGINATVVRSVNTSVVALLPVAALLFIGSGLLAGGMLKDIALSLFIGLSAGTFSSIMIATPVAVDLKLREPAIKEHDERVRLRRSKAEARGGGQNDALEASEEEGDDEEPRDADPAHSGAGASAARPGGQRRPPSGRGTGSGRAGRRR